MVCNESIVDMVNWMRIDEEGIFKLKGSTDTDHNTITAEIHMPDIEIPPKQKTVVWRLNGPEENWKKFDKELKKLEGKAYQWFQAVENDINPAYSKIDKRNRCCCQNKSW